MLIDKFIKKEGGNIVLGTAALSLLLIFAMFAINAAYYYNFRARLEAAANTIASHAGNFLPNPYLANAAANNMLKIVKANFGSLDNSLPNDISLSVYFETYELDESGNATLSRIAAPSDWNASTLKLPIKSLTVILTANFNAKLVNFFSPASEAVDTGQIEVQASATTQLVPTDVVLVIENSNSVISPLSDETTSVGCFSNWGGFVAGRTDSATAEYGARITNSVTSETLKERQCFGVIHKDIKRAALLAFDYLTASGTYRVGLVHSLAHYGEAPTATLEITANSYAKAYSPLAQEASLLKSPTIGSITSYSEYAYALGSNYQYGEIDYEASRCAAMTEDGKGFEVPSHPLTNYLSSSFTSSIFRTDLTTLLACNGQVDAACPNNSHLAPKSAAQFLAREKIWIMNAGKTFQSGLPNPQYDYSRMQFSIFRAIDMLKAAPARADKLKVERKVVLVFTDGFERPTVIENASNSGLNAEEFSRTPNVARSDTSFTTNTFNLAATASGSGLTDNYCEDVSGNIIYNSSVVALVSGEDNDTASPTFNEGGIKLGILYYGDRSMYLDNDPMTRLKYLQGHDAADENASGVSSFRTNCNTLWAQDRGRFLLEVSGQTITELADEATLGSYYYEKAVPITLRSLFVSELLKTNAIAE